MQLFALDDKDSLIAAGKARKRHNYTCLECRSVVRVRAGLHRQPHFFHLKPTLSCHLSAKSMVHLQVQNHFLKILPMDECKLERRFPPINRIADVVWEEQKIIFEVQCSAISADEVRERNKDYASQGYQVVWILHDKRFNQTRYSGAEHFLRAHPHYFTNMNAEGHGSIYDQFDLLWLGKRIHKQSSLPIDASRPLMPAYKVDDNMPRLLSERVKSWPLHFAGDLIDQIHVDKDYLSLALQIEQATMPKAPRWTESIYNRVHKLLIRPYQLLFQLLLERACK